MSPELTLCHNALKNIKIAKVQLSFLKEKMILCLGEDDLELLENVGEQLDGAMSHIDAYYVHFRSIFRHKK